ncbi:MAG: integrase core domain-containing protein [Chloroflexota bacterium]
MIFHWLLCFWSFVVDVALVRRMGDREKDLEILLLRQQLRIVERRQQRGPVLERWEKLPLVALTARLQAGTTDWRERLTATMLLFKPDTVLKWQRELVRRKWTFKQTNKSGRPRVDPEIERWIVRLVNENPRWGSERIHGELVKLGFRLDPKTVRNVMKRRHLPPSPQHGASSWRTFLNHYKPYMLACDFFTVETVWLQTLYVLFFIELGTRRVYLAGISEHPNSVWVAQQARQLTWQLQTDRPGAQPLHFLIHDNDTKFSTAFDSVFAAEKMEIVFTPPRTPQANAFAERWVRSVRTECLDQLLILDQRHLKHVLDAYIEFYNHSRPHQGLNQNIPMASPNSVSDGPIGRRDSLGGLLHDYFRRAA